ncbi:MAG TPA: MFS transporter [Methylomirabilota bacterium]|nr:MFS transporter [Methylomirabilota bacterium]
MSPADAPPARYRFVALALIIAVQTASNLGALGLPALAPLLREDLGLSRQEAGSFLSAFYVGGALTSFPAGWLADRIGVRRTLLAGQALVAASFALMTLAPGYPGLLALVVLAGIGFGAVNPTSTKGVLVWFPARSRATVVGVKQAGFPLGGALGALTLPTLATAAGLGWRGALGAAAGAIALSAVLVGLAYREPPGAAATTPVGAPRPRARAVLASRPIWLVSWATFLYAAVQVSWISYAPLYLSEVVGLSAVGAGLVLGLAQSGGILGRVGFGVLSDRVLGGRRLAVLIGAGVASGILCVATGGLQPGSSATWLALVALAFGVAGIGWNGVHHTLVAELAGRDSAATAVGLCLAVSSLGVIAGAPLVGALADRLGGYGAGWAALAGAMAVAVLLLLPVREPAAHAWR